MTAFVRFKGFLSSQKERLQAGKKDERGQRNWISTHLCGYLRLVEP